MSAWGWATCPTDGEPLIGTFKVAKKEFVCHVCATVGSTT